jgi:hypothetical protein
MAEKLYYHDLNLAKVSALVEARIQNITTSNRTTLGGTLNTTNRGLIVFDIDENTLYLWSGTVWLPINTNITGAMTLKGVVAHNATEPTSPQTGDYYVFSSAGNNTWETDEDVESGDMVVWDGTNWRYINRNVYDATETLAGKIEIATQSETNTATDDTRAITPLKLAGFISNRALAKVYFASGLNTTANTPLTITHNLSLQNRNGFTINVMDSGHSAVSVDVDSVNTNSLTITTAVAVSGLNVTIIGF